MVLEDGYRTHAWCWLRGQEKRAPPGRFPSCPASSHRLRRCMNVAHDATAVKTRADYTTLIRDSQAAVLASAERITVVGRWVVLAAAVILNHFGNENSAASVFIVDSILFGWGLVNLVVSVVLVRGFRPGRWFGFVTTGIDMLVATSILYFAGGYGASTDFSLLFYFLIIASAIRLGRPCSLATAVDVAALDVL